jgi:hypothetical protein
MWPELLLPPAKPKRRWPGRMCPAHASNRNFGEMLHKLEDLAQLFFSPAGRHLDRPAQVTLFWIEIGEGRQLLGMKMADAYLSQGSKIAQQDNRIRAARKHFAVRPELNLIENHLTRLGMQ